MNVTAGQRQGSFSFTAIYLGVKCPAPVGKAAWIRPSI